MYSLPVLLDLDDFHMLWTRILPVMDYTRALKDSFDRLYLEGESNGRLMALNLHPWLIGQPLPLQVPGTRPSPTSPATNGSGKPPAPRSSTGTPPTPLSQSPPNPFSLSLPCRREPTPG